MNQTKSQLYDRAKIIKNSYRDCYGPISNYKKAEILYYIKNCSNNYREEGVGEDILSAQSKICNRSGINQLYQDLFDNYIFNDELNSDNIEIKKNIINIDLPIDSYIYRNINPHVEFLKFYKIKYLGGGTYGDIFLYYNYDYNIEFALKKEKLNENHNDDPIEERISNLLNEEGNNCNTIKVKFFFQDIGHSYYILNKLEGDLSYLVKKLNNFGINNPQIKEIKLNIAEQVRKQVVCLYELDNDFIYTDLKLPNILYGCPDKDNLNEFKIHLGDLGSVIKDIDGYYVSTYLPYELKDTRGIIHLDEDEQINGLLAWLIGLILLDLIGSEESNYLLSTCYWSSIGGISEGDFRNICEQIGNLVEDYYDSPNLGRYFNFNMEERPDINDSLIE
jgi:hypothetical protein